MKIKDLTYRQKQILVFELIDELKKEDFAVGVNYTSHGNYKSNLSDAFTKEPNKIKYVIWGGAFISIVVLTILFLKFI
jgi:hypothetical protein